MFILALIGGILIGYILKGKLQNLSKISLKGMYLIIIAFIIEFFIIILIQNEILAPSISTYIVNGTMYIFIFAFIYMNRKNPYIVLMGIGFILNALAIFSNGGTMPVSGNAVEAIGFSTNVHGEGLYSLIEAKTNLSFLGDIIPIDFIGRFIVSVGDLVSALGMILFVVTGMKGDLKILRGK
jgi:Family of unknown function (DUF5317)